jgi:hypothetical protein
VKAWETPFALADKVAGCVVGTDDTVAAKPALLAYCGTTTLAGTVTAELLLARFTVILPLVFLEFNVTEQAKAPGPVIEGLLHDRSARLTAGAVPFPVSAIDALGLLEALLLTVILPDATYSTVGSNCTSSVAA